MFDIGQKVCLKLRGLNLPTIILDKKRQDGKIFYRIDWFKINFNVILNQVWVVENSLVADLQE